MQKLFGHAIYQHLKTYWKKYPSVILFLITAISVIYGLHAVLFHPSQFLYYHQYDQMRNYYAYLYYLQQDFSYGIFRFTGMNYPYGDFIFYTDNTPLIALVVKVISHYIIDLTPIALPIYNWLMALSIPVSAVLFFHILNHFSSHRFINFFSAFCFAWINPQALLINTTVNLSLSMIVLAELLLLIKILNHSSTKIFFRLTGVLVLLQVLSCFIHIYYLAILGLYSVVFFFLWGLNELYHRRAFIRIWTTGLLQFLFSFGICFLIIRSIDRYYALRNVTARGYDWIEWKLNFSSLFTTYPFFRAKYIFQSNDSIPYASYYYLGGFFLYLITFCIVLWLIKSKYRLPLRQIVLAHQNRNAYIFLMIVSLLGVFVALGETYTVGGSGILFRNMFNPLMYLGWYTPMVTQFRALARFAYFFFWIMNITGIIMIVYAWRNFNEIAVRIVIIVLMIILALDAKNAIELARNFHKNTPNLYARGKLYDEMTALAREVESQNFQAFLPIPYFCVGTEDYTITIDPDDNFITATMIFSLKTGLPMMASSMGRTPPEFTRNELSIFLEGQLHPEVKSKMKDSPILILYNPSYYKDSVDFKPWPPVRYEPALTAFKNGRDMISGKPLQKIAEAGDWILFKANPQDL